VTQNLTWLRVINYAPNLQDRVSSSSEVDLDHFPWQVIKYVRTSFPQMNAISSYTTLRMRLTQVIRHSLTKRTKLWWTNLFERASLENPQMYKRITLRWSLRYRLWGADVNWTGSGSCSTASFGTSCVLLSVSTSSILVSTVLERCWPPQTHQVSLICLVTQ
jgi:hypothetical protein